VPRKQTMEDDLNRYLPLAKEFIDFVNNSPSPFHAVATSKRMLLEAGFQQINEREQSNLEMRGKYFFTRNQTTLVAFYFGGNYQHGNAITMIGAHTDSPNFLIKPNFSTEMEGYHQLKVEPYGGGLWTTWFDRDLTIAGRVIVRTSSGFEGRLVHVKRPILRIPTLAIHLDRESGSRLEINKQEHLVPIIATAIKSKLEKQTNSSQVIEKLLSKELNCSVESICDFELSVCDSQKAEIGGMFEEFIFSQKLDNLVMSFCGLKALLRAVSNDQGKESDAAKNVFSLLLFDHEEVGSESAFGAGSPIASELIRLCSREPFIERTLRRSFLVSADMAHAVHPNYRGKHDENHKPILHQGPVIKRNANQRYATSAEGALVIRELARRNSIPIQDFVVRTDSLCGSTIGPILSANTGIRTVDVGNPQLSMHSIREMCGTSDITHAVNLFTAFYEQFPALDDSIKID